MSNMVRKVSKSIRKKGMKYHADMYQNTLGSVIISACILAGKNESARINRCWRNLTRHPEKVDFWLDDENFIDKTLNLFGMERPENFPIAMVQSDFNVLFMPYVDGQLFPLREDGVFPQTAKKGKIYPINWEVTNTVSNNGEVAVNTTGDK